MHSRNMDAFWAIYMARECQRLPYQMDEFAKHEALLRSSQLISVVLPCPACIELQRLLKGWPRSNDTALDLKELGGSDSKPWMHTPGSMHEEIEKEEKEMEGANRELSCSSKVIKICIFETCSLTWPLFSSSISGTCPGKDASNRKLAGEKLSPPRTLSYLPGTCKSLAMFLEGFILRLS